MKKSSIVFLSLGMLIMCATFFWSCDRESSQDYDQDYGIDIINSPEFEDFIIASADLQQAHLILEKELQGLNFFNLETTIGANGKEVKHLPASISDLKIEDKTSLVVEKRELLINKFPEFACISMEELSYYVNECVKNSVRVNSYFLENNINISQPSTRYDPNEDYVYDNQLNLISDLYNWTLSSNFVEVAILFFKDGRCLVYRDPGNTDTECNITLANRPGESRYYYPDTSSPSNEVVSVAHTHTYYSNATDPDDYNLAKTFSGLPMYIYFQRSFYRYR